MPRLLISGGDGLERTVELTERTVQIGRGPGNDVVLPDAHQGVSRSHAELRFRNGRCVLVDLQSQNGTFLNGQRIEHAEVPYGAEIGVGSYRLRLQRPGSSEEEEVESALQPPPSTVGPLCGPEGEVWARNGPHSGPRPAERAEETLATSEGIRGISPLDSARGALSDSRRATAKPLAGFAPPLPDLEKTGFGDIPIIRPTINASEPTVPLTVARSTAPIIAIAGGTLMVVLLAGATWLLLGRSPEQAAEPSLPMPDLASVEPAPAPAADAAPLPAAPAAEIPSTAVPPDVATPAPAVAAPASNPSRPASNAAPSVRPDGLPVARKPGETVEAWRIRTAAFQTRYAYSRAALDRGDFAAAAGGFEAILREEPGFLDVPQLLVRARAGLRDVARAVYESGERLDAAGDWMGALQKYEQAGQIHPDVRGLSDAIKRVREKLSAAGQGALLRARRFDESGRWSDALKEYAKAAQWLPPTDPKRQMALSRVEQLKKSSR